MPSGCAECGRPVSRIGETLCVACQLKRGLATPGELYASFLSQHPTAPAEEFDRFLADRADHADELRRLHDIHRSARNAARSTSSLEPPHAHPSEPGPTWPAGGRYEIEGVVARGGMGIIYSVRDRELNRRIAMKIIGAGSGGPAPLKLEDLPPHWVDRFVEEAQITAQLDHPGIVPVHEMGLDPAGRLYFTMKLVRGQNLGEIFARTHAKDTDWNLTRVVRALLQACQAVAHAHEQGVVHRDLKPENIMVGHLGEVFVMDWGVARSADRQDVHELRLASRSTATSTPGPAADNERPGSKLEPESETAPEPEVGSDTPRPATDSPLVTLDGTVLGTPAYMSPEHAHGQVSSLGPRSDVYSLGAVIYQLLAGHPPYVPPGAPRSPKQILHGVLTGPPTAIQTVARRQPAELVAICAKAMARDPRHRYPNAGALAEDLQAWLDRRVVQAHQTGALAELKAWILRNRLAAFSQATGVLLIVAGLLLVIFLQNRASQRIAAGKAAIERLNADLRGTLYRATITRAVGDLERGDTLAAQEAAETCEPDLRAWEWHHLQRRFPRAIRIPATRTNGIVRAASSRDDQWLVGIDADRNLRVWDANTGQLRRPPLPLETTPYSVALSPDNRSVAVGGTNGSLQFLRLSDGSTLWTANAHTRRVDSMAFTPDGTRLVTGGADGRVCLWETATGRRLSVSEHPGNSMVSVSPDGTLIACSTYQRSTLLLDAMSLRQVGSLGDPSDLHTAAAFSPDGLRIATAGIDQCLRLWDVRTGQPVPGYAVTPEGAFVASVAWSPDGQWIAGGVSSADIRVREADSGRLHARLATRHTGWLPQLQFSRDSRKIVASIQRNAAGIQIWDIAPEPPVTVVPAHGDRAWSAAFTPDSRRVLTAGWDGLLALSDADDGRRLRTFRGHTNLALWSVRVTPDGKRGISSGQDGTLRLWDLDTGAELRTLRAQPCAETNMNVTLFLDLSPDGRRIASGGFDGHVQVWDLDTGKRLWSGRDHTNRVWSVAWSPDGTRIATAGDVGQLTLWDATRGMPLWRTKASRAVVSTVSFHPHGHRLLTSTWAGELRVWDADTGARLRERVLTNTLIRASAYSPDGRRVASTGQQDRTVRLWDAESLEPVLALPAEPQAPEFVTFSPDGSRLVSCNHDGRLRIWHASDTPGGR